MRRQICVRTGRRGTVIAASAAVLCLGGTLAACGGGTGAGGYTAVGAVGERPGATSGAVAPSGKVTLIPLDGARGGGSHPGASPSPSRPSSPTSSPSPGSGDAGADATRPGAPGRPGQGSGASSSGTGSGGAPAKGSGPAGGAGGSGGPGSAGGSGSPTSPAPPAGPAVLEVGAPVRTAADERWCEKVTVEFRNTGGTPARSGTVTFATHIIGGLGIDWATRRTTAPLPGPIGAGAALKKTYTVCVDAWRVPLGMHVETRDVTAVWE